jgi:hypothetical protein
VVHILSKEKSLIVECLDTCTLDSLISSVKDILITQVSMQILNHKDFQTFMEQERIEDLQRIFDLFSLVDSP